MTAFWILYKWILIPLLNLNRIGKILTYDDAAKIIGQHFTDINDKLLNTLQLFESLDKNDQNKELLLASIDQKVNSYAQFLLRVRSIYIKIKIHQVRPSIVDYFNWNFDCSSRFNS